MIDRRNLRALHPFTRLDRLLGGIPPGPSGLDGDKPVLLSVGEPQNQPPAFVAEELARHAAGWSRYPGGRPIPDYAAAAVDWLGRRYGLPAGMVDPKRHLLPLPGSREGLFFAALAAIPQDRAGPPPLVLLPNPFYHVYAGSAIAAGAEPVFVPADAKSGQLPDFTALPEVILERTSLAFFCSPSNPQGAAADLEVLCGLLALARRHGFALAMDECYTEIYNREPPPGALQAAARLGGSLDNLLVFHSLSKRSSAPGLRCGFVAGDEALIEPLDVLLRVGGAGVPQPVQAAGARLWREEAHVAANRERYRRNFTLAERLLGNRFGTRTPDGGFFLWLDVGDGEAAATRLWREAGIRVLPGAYMCQAPDGGDNPGAPYIRVALVYDENLCEHALGRLADLLDG